MIRSVSALVCTLVLAYAVPAFAGINVGKPTFKPIPPNQTVNAGAPIQFSISGSFKPPEPSGTPWITFVWNWGDGSPIRSQRYNGEGTHTDAPTHTFAQGGIYTVTVTGGHGFDFIGFRFFKTKTFQVAVGCPGADRGPKKCEKGEFTPFEGEWHAPQGSGFDSKSMVLTQVGNKVLGTATLQLNGNDYPISINGKVSNTKLPGDVQALQVKFKDRLAFGPTPIDLKGRLVMSIASGSTDAYRLVSLTLTPPAPAAELKGTFFLLERPDKIAKLCTSVAGGKKKAEPDELIVFAVTAQNEGKASMPAYFGGWEVSVAGGTIENFSIERAGFRSTSTATNMTIDFDTLGAGKGQNNARAFGFFLVRPNPGSDLVTFDTTTFADPTPSDTLTVVQPPPLRRVCVPIVE